MQGIFIKRINIKKVRHLQDVEIQLSEKEKKHLILTGKNGSGKTSFIHSLSKALAVHYINVSIHGNIHKKVEHWEPCEDEHIIHNGKDCINSTGVEVFCNKPCNDSLQINTMMNVDGLIHTIFADRKLTLQEPKSIEAIDIEKDILHGEIFLKYLLYMNYQRINAITSNDEYEAKKLQKWFDIFVNTLRDIYDCPQLELIHNSKDLSYKIIVPGREPFGLNEMADGYSSFLYIVIELIMKMEKKASAIYDMPGIVLIDEIETHLHVELQKQILPFLTKMFPNIQFIITTHSPFVITSVPNAIVYDLEKRIAVEDMSAYSYEAVIEHYYDVHMYSIEANRQFEIYKSLVKKVDPSPDEMEQLINSITYLKRVPAGAAEELVYSFREMEAQRRLQQDDKT